MDHDAELRALLPGYLRHPRWLALAAAVARQIQQVEDVHQAMLAGNALHRATGDLLDQIGKIVQQPRGGAEDAVYRRRIAAKVATNRSLGLVEDIIRVAELVVNDPAVVVQIDQQGTAAYVARLLGPGVPDATAADLIAFGKRATSAGVRALLEYSTVGDDDTFTFDGPAGRGFVAVPTLSLSTLALPSGMNTVIGIRPEWLDASGGDVDGITLEFFDSGSEAMTDGVDCTLEFQSGVSTIASVEALLNSSSRLFVVTPSTVSATLIAGDAFGSISVSQNPGAPGGVFATVLE